MLTRAAGRALAGRVRVAFSLPAGAAVVEPPGPITLRLAAVPAGVVPAGGAEALLTRLVVGATVPTTAARALSDPGLAPPAGLRLSAAFIFVAISTGRRVSLRHLISHTLQNRRQKSQRLLCADPVGGSYYSPPPDMRIRSSNK